MKMDLFVQMSGTGYSRLAEQRRKTVWSLLSASSVFFVVALLLLSGVVILINLRDERTVFTAPPPLKTYQPREMEHRVKVQRRQRSSSRPQITPRMVSTSLSQFALPEIPVDPKVVQTTFQPEFKAVTGMGLGVGLGTGLGLGGFGSGVSEFDFFGIRGRAERIAIILDASVSMAEETEELGVTQRGIAHYARVKARVAEVIDALSAHSMFNVIVYAQTASAWRDELQVANEANKQSAKQYILPFNSRVDWNAVGHASGLTSMDAGLGDYATGGTTRFDLALSLAIKSGADTILVICDGDVWTTRLHAPGELAAHERAVQQWQQQHAAALAAGAAAGAATAGQTQRVWVEGRAAQEAVIRERGGRQASAATEGRWVERPVHTGSTGRGRGAVPPQPQLPPAIWTLADYQNHIDKLHEEFLAPKGRPKPTIHVIGFRSGREDSGFLRDLARAYNGQFRRVARMR